MGESDSVVSPAGCKLVVERRDGSIPSSPTILFSNNSKLGVLERPV